MANSKMCISWKEFFIGLSIYIVGKAAGQGHPGFFGNLLSETSKGSECWDMGGNANT